MEMMHDEYGNIGVTINTAKIDGLYNSIIDLIRGEGMSVVEIDMALAEVSFQIHEAAREGYAKLMDSVNLENLN